MRSRSAREPSSERDGGNGPPIQNREVVEGKTGAGKRTGALEKTDRMQLRSMTSQMTRLTLALTPCDAAPIVESTDGNAQTSQDARV